MRGVLSLHSAAHRDPTSSAGATRGLVMDLGWRYDLMVGIFDVVMFRGRLRALPRTAADLAGLRPGEAVLDVGCGTGALALVARERVGETGRVAGIDPGPRQIARARSKAARRNLSVDFQVGVVEDLAFPDGSFDVVLSTLMMHHLPDDLKRRGLAEIARVLEPGGRLLIVDFKRPEEPGRRSGRLGAGGIGIQDQPELMTEAGFSQIETGEIRLPRFPGVQGVGFALGRKPAAAAGGSR
ncbi:MAG TPA: class I SAM-dependent methyltransferase [Longimicrobiales bacterium]